MARLTPHALLLSLLAGNQAIAPDQFGFENVCCDSQHYYPTAPRWLLWASGALLLYPIAVSAFQTGCVLWSCCPCTRRASLGTLTGMRMQVFGDVVPPACPYCESPEKLFNHYRRG